MQLFEHNTCTILYYTIIILYVTTYLNFAFERAPTPVGGLEYEIEWSGYAILARLNSINVPKGQGKKLIEGI